jgi:RimJ/RimL family protein N-acetyltransferase
MTLLTTARMTARPACSDDVDLVRAIFSAPEVGRWTSRDARPWTEIRILARTGQFAAHWEAHGFGLRFWFLGDRLAGVAGLQHKIVDGAGAVEASFAFLPAHWRKGLATEAMAASMEEAPEICREVRAVTLPGNIASQKVLERVGFTPDGETAEGDRLYRSIR